MRGSEPVVRKDSRLFAAICNAVLSGGHAVRFRVHGESMQPNLLDGDDVTIAPAALAELRRDDVVLAENADGLLVHRVSSCELASGSVTLRSDTGEKFDAPAQRIYGKALSLTRGSNEQPLNAFQTRFVHPLRAQLRRLRAAAKLRLGHLAFLFFAFISALFVYGALFAPAVHAQTADLSLTQTASAATVPVSTSYSYSEVVKNVTSSATVATNTIIVYMQTPPNTTYQSYAGTNWTCTNPGANNTGPIVCTYGTTLATGNTASTLTVTFKTNAGVAAGTTIQNSATVTTNGNNAVADSNPSNNTSLSTIYVEPAGSADVALSMSVSPTPVFVSASINYTVTVTNLGPAQATGVTVTDTFPSSLTFGSATPSQGTCNTSLSLSCSLGAINANSSATITVTLTTPSSATTLTNTATVTTTTTDNNTANNSATTYTVVQPLSCAMPGLDGAGGTLSGVVNAYYPPAATGVLASGATSMALGTAAGSPAAQHSISAGDLLLIIQMQGSPINNSNSSSYGHGVPGDPGAGYTAIGSSGLFEFVTVTATNPNPLTTAGGTVTFTGTGPTGGLLNSYSYELPLASTSLGTATAASWAGNVATFTFSTLPSTVVPNAVLTTTGFTPAGYNVTEAPILSVNTSAKTVTVAMTSNPGTETALGTATYVIPGQQTFQVIRVPQYTSATLSSTLTALAWNGSLGGVLAIDVASQLALGGTVALDSLGFRGAGGIILTGTTGGAVTDYVFASPATLTSAGTDASKGEGIAGTPHWLAPLLSPGGTPISPATTASSSGQSYTEGLVGGSFARGAPGNAGGGGTDGLPSNNSYNSGGGAGANGGAGGQGGYGWNSMATTNSTDGGFGGVAFPASTSALIMGGGGGAGTTNDGSYYTSSGGNADCGANCTGIYSSGGAGGGIAIIHAGSVTGTGTITANGEATLTTENDSTGGGGAGGSILVFANSGNLSGLTVNAIGGSAGNAWPAEGPDTGTTGFPGQRHGPGGGGGGGVIFLSAAPASYSVNGGANGYTDTVQDSYGATPGQAGTLVTTDLITETPGTQSGAYCGSADLAVTNSAPAVVTAGTDIIYTQSVTNNGPLDAVNAVFSESIPANTTYVGYTAPSGWTCQTPITTTFTCTNPDVPASPTAQQFTLTVLVPSTVAYGTQIVDTDNVTSGTSDPNLANNSATVTTSVGLATQADVAVTLTASAPTVTAGSNFIMSATIVNNGPATASNLVFSEPLASNSGATIIAALVSYSAPGWSCGTFTNNGVLTLNCLMSSLAAGTANASTITITETAPSTAPSGTVLSSTASIAESTLDPNYSNNSSTASVLVGTTGQADLAVTASGTPNPVTAGNNITYTQTVTNNGPTAITAASGTSPTTVTFTDAIPANTTLVSFTPPSNWTCNTIAVGGTGTFTCTLNVGQTLNTVASGSNYSATFPMVVKVNAGTTATSITNSPSVASSVSDPNSANNTATVTTTIASPTQAYVTITKTASPEPVNENANLAYTIIVTNNGPAIAQNVVVTDPIQTAQVTYVSSFASQGSCTEATNTVTCTIGTLSVGSSATVVINVTPIVVGSSIVTCNGQNYNTCNTATLTTGTSNPNPNTSSSAGSTLQYSTAVDFASLSAVQQADGSVRVVWRTLEESRNLGFHIYREDASGQHRVDSSLIAGSALILRNSRPQHAAKSYAWIDAHPVPGAAYWVEDLDINGTRTMHGPAYPELASSATNQPQTAQAAYTDSPAISPSLRQVQSSLGRTNEVVPRPTTPLPNQPPTPPAGTPLFNTAEYPAVKIYVDQEGWYHIPFAQLFAAGLEPNTDVRLLHLYAEGVEQPLLLVGHTAGYPAPTDAIEFYGTGINTPFSGTRVYWLVRENSYGKHMVTAPAAYTASAAPESFPFTTIREDHTTYFAALLNGENNDNFFGDLVTSDPVDETLTVVHRDTSSTAPLTLTLALQGVTDQQEHAVTVQFNGTNIGTLAFYGEILATQTYSVDPSLVLDGTNSVTLTALEGDNDVSLVQSVQLQYPHTYTADSDWLKATANAGSELQITRFANATVRLFDITDPLNIVELSGKVSSQDSGTYSISATVPAGQPYTRTILAFSQEQLSAPSSLAAYSPPNLNQQRSGADIVIITHPDFVSHLTPLVNFRTSQGYKVLQVTTDELFDQYNFGERSPFALQTYLQNAASQWQRKPQAILLVGDASMDPRNYLGFGDFDFVPTRIIETAAFKTASDDWFTDFQQTGFATIPTGRLPVRTTSDLDLIISKIIGYEQGQSAGTWNSQVVLIADQNVDSNFSSAVNAAAATLPSYLQTTQILTNGMDPSTAHSQIVNALNNGALIVDYNGHGAEQQWSFSDIFDDASAAALTNGGRLPVYLLMDCLNGLFQDVYAETLAKSLILAPNGGAVAVWASSGFTNQPPQAAMELGLLNEFSAHPHEMFGLMVLRAKSGSTDNDVRRTWILFGDPAMKLHFTSVATSNRPTPNPPVSNPPRNCVRGVPCPLERPQ